MALGIGIVLGVAAEADPERDFGMRDFPRVAEVKPVVQHLDLPAVLDGLIENAEFVADAVARRRNFERGQRIEIARSQTAEAAIAEAGLFFLFQKLVERQA